MKVFSLLLTLFLLASCSYDSSNESGFIVVGHKPVEDAFVLTLPANAAYNEGDNLNFVLTHPKIVTVDTTGGANGQDTITYVKDGNTIQLDEFEVGLGSWTQDTGDAQDFS